MARLLRKLFADDSGQDLAEYGIALAIITVTVALAAGAIGTDVQALWSTAQTQMASVAGAVN